MADGAGVPGVRMVADGAWVRVDIATNKEQYQDKEGGPVNKKKKEPPSCDRSTGGPAKNSLRQWGRPFGRAPREICPAISTRPHWGGDCTTTLRWQDVGAAIVCLIVCLVRTADRSKYRPFKSMVKFLHTRNFKQML